MQINAWTDREDAIVREDYAEAKREDILARLPGRTWDAVVSRAHKLGVRRLVGTPVSTWPEHDDNILRTVYPTIEQIEDIIPMLEKKRSRWSIIHRAMALKIRRDNEVRAALWREAMQETFAKRGKKNSEKLTTWEEALAKYKRAA